MPTVSERKALMFLAAIAIAGGGVRWSQGRQLSRDVRTASRVATNGITDSIAEGGLDAQIAAVDSARGSPSARSSRGRSRRSRTNKPISRSTGAPSTGENRTSRDGAERSKPPSAKLKAGEGESIDVNSASAEELARLPRVGPVLAQRIVAFRDAHGAFDSMAALRHVHGIGSATASLLAPLVTFSSGYRPSH